MFSTRPRIQPSGFAFTRFWRRTSSFLSAGFSNEFAMKVKRPRGVGGVQLNQSEIRGGDSFAVDRKVAAQFHGLLLRQKNAAETIHTQSSQRDTGRHREKLSNCRSGKGNERGTVLSIVKQQSDSVRNLDCALLRQSNRNNFMIVAGGYGDTRFQRKRSAHSAKARLDMLP
jgi:hypothetical protein